MPAHAPTTADAVGRGLCIQLVDVAFKYDTVVMEEAAQILEVETFIPLLLQTNNDDSGAVARTSRLQRVVLIGDHNQLPPVVKNMAFQRYGNMEQSLFSRFVRLGVPTVTLDAQGRARPSLAALFAWRYPGLGNLPAVTHEPAYLAANTGFAYDFQVQCASRAAHVNNPTDDRKYVRACFSVCACICVCVCVCVLACRSWWTCPTLMAAASRSHCRTFTRTLARPRSGVPPLHPPCMLC
jgi:hypothetical protein